MSETKLGKRNLHLGCVPFFILLGQKNFNREKSFFNEVFFRMLALQAFGGSATHYFCECD